MNAAPDFPFTTDGCSGAIYRTIFRRDPPWLGCCIAHDEIYWRGGSARKRKQADIGLMCCVAQNGHPVVAFIMYVGVRIGVMSILPTPWRWGYGWKWPRSRE